MNIPLVRYGFEERLFSRIEKLPELLNWKDYYRIIHDPDKEVFYWYIGMSQYFEHGNGD